MTVGNYNLNQIWLQISKNQHRINMLVVSLLALYLLAYAANLTWRLIPTPKEATLPTRGSNYGSQIASQPSARLDINSIIKLNLFGDVAAKPAVVQQVTEAPETRLNLTLTGVVATSDPKIAAAIIENRGKQNTYGINEKIDGTNALLKEVFADRVIIKNGARRETLMLDGIDYEQIGSSGGPSITRPRAPNVSPPVPPRSSMSEEAIAASRELMNSPANFMDYFAIVPHQQDGRMVGYRISPGKKSTLFEEVGFQAGDVVVEMNGLDLTDPQQSREAMQAMTNGVSMQLTVNRDGELVSLYFDIPTSGME